MRIEQIHPNNLGLDLKNPRFGLRVASNEEEALEELLAKANLKELWDSIAVRGFEQFEPLVAFEDEGKLVVIEGNRRLAAVKLILQPHLIGAEHERKRLPFMSEEVLASCASLPVRIVESRAHAAGYIGFKHVNGPTRWSSIAKAKFGVDFYESMEKQLTPQERMRELTKQLGDSRGLIIRLLVAYKIVLQGIDLGYFGDLGVDVNSIEFSHLYTLINNADSRAFIGLSRAPLNEEQITKNPVPESHHRALKEILGYLYGPKSVIKSQGTDRPRLQRVLASRDGIEELRITGDLNSAEAIAGIQSSDWLKNIAKISGLLQSSSNDVTKIVDELSSDEVEYAKNYMKRMERQIKQIKSSLPGGEFA